MNKLLYLHGLESQQGGKKVDFLSSQYFVYAPALNYRTPNCFSNLYEQLKYQKTDIVIGSSMGGYFAFKLSQVLSISTVILLNPALSFRSIPIHIPPYQPISDQANYHLHLGKEDKIINPKATIEFMQQQQIPHQVYWYDYGHRTPIETIINALDNIK